MSTVLIAMLVAGLVLNCGSGSKAAIDRADMDLNVTDVLNSKIYGSGDIILMSRDTIENHLIELNGFGNIRAYSFPTYDTKIKVNASGSAYLNVISDLDIKIYGIGNVFYQGHPQLHIDDNGEGEVINSNL